MRVEVEAVWAKVFVEVLKKIGKICGAFLLDLRCKIFNSLHNLIEGIQVGLWAEVNPQEHLRDNFYVEEPKNFKPVFVEPQFAGLV